ncbi:MAG: Tol-Pal system beta propeller repeat protein TolB [Arenicellales bacterium]|jgi:TolB protein|nr:Tol-Pal system beta propeller repeat protein TolB [Arenicellales bacterium]MDP7283979.1 Tol-Pal system beta propeller repeat protein TolB [Arenicellales bacterium]
MWSRVLITVILLAVASPARAVLTIEINKGIEAGIPIAVVPFQWSGEGVQPANLREVISLDLNRSGRFESLPKRDFLSRPHSLTEIRFKDWRLLKAEALVIGKLRSIGPDQFEVRFRLIDVFKQKQMVGYVWKVSRSKLRSIGHKIADIIHKELTGLRGAFDTRIAYITVVKTPSQGLRYLLQIADSDGFNEKTMLDSKEPILSPSWSPDGRILAYVSFEGGRSTVWLQNIKSGKRAEIASFEGINSAPAWSPNGKQLAMTLSRDGNPEVYVMTILGKKLQRITRHTAIDTEPAWSPDGRYLVFTSDRGGKPQIYRVLASGGRPERITFQGKYNAGASYSPDGSQLVLVTNQGKGYRIAIYDFASRSIMELTRSQLDESPSFAPNGGMVLYATDSQNRGVLSAVSADGRVSNLLKFREGDVREPDWAPYNR